MIGKDCYIPKELTGIFELETLTKSQAKLLAFHYFGRLIEHPLLPEKFVFLDFRQTPQDRLKSIRSLKMPDLVKQGMLQNATTESDSFSLKLFRQINDFGRFMDFVRCVIEKRFSDVNLKVTRIDPLGRAWVIYNGAPTNEWARLRADGFGKCYYARLKLLLALREEDTEKRFGLFLLLTGIGVKHV